jgi:LmbE family N-acetylglucosaminyl deacetylase
MSEATAKVNVSFAESEIVSSDWVVEWGKTLIVAPHPDDESLGCGGAITLLRKFGCEVLILTMSDGTLSHPNSVKYPAEKLRDLRESEMRAALKILDVELHRATFFRFKDRHVPNESDSGFESAVTKITEYLRTNQPKTVLVPWRRDPHPDHRATWQIFNRANEVHQRRFRILEYPIWLWEMAENVDLPTEKNIKISRLDISSAVETKQRAIHAHASQTTDLIDDDPEGFRLSPEILAHFDVPFETYLEQIYE